MLSLCTYLLGVIVEMLWETQREGQQLTCDQGLPEASQPYHADPDQYHLQQVCQEAGLGVPAEAVQPWPFRPPDDGGPQASQPPPPQLQAAGAHSGPGVLLGQGLRWSLQARGPGAPGAPAAS